MKSPSIAPNSIFQESQLMKMRKYSSAVLKASFTPSLIKTFRIASILPTKINKLRIYKNK